MELDKETALIVSDVQNDFCPGGALQVKDGDLIIPACNKYIEMFEKKGLTIYYIADWHPPNHCSFKVNGGIWPVHCVQNSTGAAFHPDLKIATGACMIRKGTDPIKEAYSGFEQTELHANLQKDGIRKLYIAGLATDYCVKNTVIDACHHGYKVIVLLDAVKGVEVNLGDSARALKMMKDVGATFITRGS